MCACVFGFLGRMRTEAQRGKPCTDLSQLPNFKHFSVSRVGERGIPHASPLSVCEDADRATSTATLQMVDLDICH